MSDTTDEIIITVTTHIDRESRAVSAHGEVEVLYKNADDSDTPPSAFEIKGILHTALISYDRKTEENALRHKQEEEDHRQFEADWNWYVGQSWWKRLWLVKPVEKFVE